MMVCSVSAQAAPHWGDWSWDSLCRVNTSERIKMKKEDGDCRQDVNELWTYRMKAYGAEYTGTFESFCNGTGRARGDSGRKFDIRWMNWEDMTWKQDSGPFTLFINSCDQL